jgi:hypothetical protein
VKRKPVFPRDKDSVTWRAVRVKLKLSAFQKWRYEHLSARTPLYQKGCRMLLVQKSLVLTEFVMHLTKDEDLRKDR